MSDNQKKTRVLGFSVYLKAGKWYAAKSIDGNLRWVYIGDDLEKAEEKVRVWCTKHGITIKTEGSIIREDVREILENGLKELKDFGLVMESRLLALEKEQLALRGRLEQLEKEKGESRIKSEPEKVDWESLRDSLKERAQKCGGNRALARVLGMSESVIRRFLKGECQTLSNENMEKLRHA